MKVKQHSFSIELAEKIGVEKAVLMANIHYWLDWSFSHGKNAHQGYHWTYNSSTGFAKLFPYWSANKIQKMLKSLEDDGYIITGCFNKAGYDRTKWYTTSDYKISQIGLMEKADPLNGLGESAQPIPIIKPDGKPVNKHIDRFEEFWDLYAKKDARPKCESKFKKLKPEEIEKIFEVLPAYVASTPDKQFRKNPYTWLNNKCWNDEIVNRSINVTSITTQRTGFSNIDYNEEM